jgi:Gram-negative bacterial TonB protein C-terminal
MKNFTILTMLLFVAFISQAQKSVLVPITFSAKDKALTASVLDIDAFFLVDKDKARAMRFKNMTVDRDSTYYDVETPATFPDGQEGLKKFISQNIIRPKNSKGETVLVRFMVERYGEINKVHVLAGPANADALLSAEAIKVVKKMGSWNPAKIQGIEVASYYVLPVKF